MLYPKLCYSEPCYKEVNVYQQFIVQKSALSVAKRRYLENVFLYLHENIGCGYSLEVPHWDASNENPKHMFLWKN